MYYFRRLSADNTPKSEGLTLEKIERVSYKETIKAIPSRSCVDSAGELEAGAEAEAEDATQCIICLSGQHEAALAATTIILYLWRHLKLLLVNNLKIKHDFQNSLRGTQSEDLLACICFTRNAWTPGCLIIGRIVNR